MDPTPLEDSTRPAETKQGDRADNDPQLPASSSAGASTSSPDADTASDRPNEGTAVAARPTPRMPLLLQTAGIDDKPRPFYNLGNSCFINASLTAPFGPSSFRTAILEIFRADEQRLRNALWFSAVSLSGRCPESPTTVPITHEERLAVTYVASRLAPTATERSMRQSYCALALHTSVLP